MWHGGDVDQPMTDAPAGSAPPTPLRLRPPRHLVSPRAIRYWAARALAGWLVLTAAEVVWMLLAGAGALRWHLAGLAVTAAAAAAHLAVMPQWRYRVHRWEATEHAVYTQAGWFSQQR